MPPESAKPLKTSRKNIKTLLRYLAEIVIIFIGITISFAFEQWREDVRHQDELIELAQSLLNETTTARKELLQDQPESAMWIVRLDSIRTYGPKKQLTPQQLNWFYLLVTGQLTFLFEANSPTFQSVLATSYWNDFPDTIRTKIYRVYNNKIKYASLLYEQQQENLNHFRLSLVESSDLLSPATLTNANPDYDVFSEKLKLGNWQNLVTQVWITEKKCYNQNEAAMRAMQELERDLEQYLKLLE